MLDEQLQVLNLKCREVQESRSNYSLRVTTNIKNLSKCSWHRYRKELLFETRLSVIITVIKVQNRKN
jgi:hypothetical protein